MSARTPLILALTLLSTAAAAAPAVAADDEVSYRVTYIGSGIYHQDWERESGDELERRATDLEVSWEAVFDDVRFRDGRLVAPVEDSIPRARTGGGHREDHRVQPQPYAVTCQHLDTDAGPGLLGRGLAMEEGEEELVIRPAERLVATMRCPDPFNPGEFWHPSFDLQSRGTGVDPAIMGAAPLDAVIDLPTEAIGAGKIVERVGMNPSQTDPAACPAQDPTGYTTTCRISWSGEVEMVRSDHVRETPSVGLRFDPRSRRLTLTVRCEAACRGLLNVSLRGPDGGRHLMQVPYRAKGGAATVITRRLGRRSVPAGTTSSGLRVRSVPL